MPPQPRFHHPLKTVRAVLGDSQTRFAQRVGCSAPNIQAIELGKHKPSEELLAQAMILTGADRQSLCQKTGKARSVLGGPLNERSFAAWKLILSDASEHVVPRYVENLLPLLTTLFLASAQKDCAFELGESLRDWMRTNQKRFKLEGACDRLLDELGDTKGLRWRDLRWRDLRWRDLDVPLTEIPASPVGTTAAEAEELAQCLALLKRYDALSLGILDPRTMARGQVLAKLLESLEAFMWTKPHYSEHLPDRYTGRFSESDAPEGPGSKKRSFEEPKDQLTELVHRANPMAGVRGSTSAGSKTKPVPVRGS